VSTTGQEPVLYGADFLGGGVEEGSQAQSHGALIQTQHASSRLLRYKCSCGSWCSCTPSCAIVDGMERNEVAANTLNRRCLLVPLPAPSVLQQKGLCASVTVGARMVQRSPDPTALTALWNFICIAFCTVERKR
jgi:hypothetical protein